MIGLIVLAVAVLVFCATVRAILKADAKDEARHQAWLDEHDKPGWRA